MTMTTNVGDELTTAQGFAAAPVGTIVEDGTGGGWCATKTAQDEWTSRRGIKRSAFIMGAAGAFVTYLPASFEHVPSSGNAYGEYLADMDSLEAQAREFMDALKAFTAAYYPELDGASA